MKRVFLILDRDVDHACRWLTVNKISYRLGIGTKGKLFSILEPSDKSFEGFMKNIGAIEMAN